MISILSQRVSQILLITALLLSSAQCANDTEPIELPPATREGRNTLGFKVDGEIWLPKGEKGFPNDIEAIEPLTVIKNGLVSFGLRANRPSGSLTIGVDKVSGEGVYDRSSADSREANFWGDGEKDQPYFYPGRTWRVTFTRVDTLERVIAGLFEFELIAPGNGDTVNITEGRFDIKY